MIDEPIDHSCIGGGKSRVVGQVREDVPCVLHDVSLALCCTEAPSGPAWLSRVSDPSMEPQPECWVDVRHDGV